MYMCVYMYICTCVYLIFYIYIVSWDITLLQGRQKIRCPMLQGWLYGMSSSISGSAAIELEQSSSSSMAYWRG